MSNTKTQPSRKQQREDFINKNISAVKGIEKLPADASSRTYYRTYTNDKSYIIMDSPPASEPVNEFIKVAKHLKKQGFYPPEIYEIDEDKGFLMLEDFKDDTFYKLLNENYPKLKLYKLATDTLIQMHKNSMMTALNIAPYDTAAYLREVELFSDWYYQWVMEKELTPKLKSQWMQLWVTALNEIPPHNTTLVLRDFHAGNLMLIKRDGVDICALLDFQDALIGHIGYDLLSLLEDIRLDVPKPIRDECYNNYKTEMRLGDDFDKTYTILSAQRHAKVLGIFIRLLKRDNKNGYLKYMPRTAKLFKETIEAPYLKNIKQWVEENMPDYFEKTKQKSTQSILQKNTC